MRWAALYLQDLWYGRRAGPEARLVLALLTLPATVYALLMGLRARCYVNGLFRVNRLPRPVISVGNITVGGTGKTPVTAWIARFLQGQGLRVVVLSRGYGGALEGQTTVVADGQDILLTPDQCGDEPYLLASTIPGLMVVIGSDRYQAGCVAMEHLQPDIFILDDGYQHMRLHRDLNILLMDCRCPVGNGRVLPAGPLREPEQAITRADLLLYTRCEDATRPDWQPPDQGVPTSRVRYQLTSFHCLASDRPVPLASLQQARVAAFAGIAHPGTFFANLEQDGIQLIATLALPDHSAYGQNLVEQLQAMVAEHAVDWLVTTEKDAVKLRHCASEELPGLVAAQLELAFEDDVQIRQAVARVSNRPAVCYGMHPQEMVLTSKDT